MINENHGERLPKLTTHPVSPRVQVDLSEFEPKLVLRSELRQCGKQTKWKHHDGEGEVDIIVSYDLKGLTRLGVFTMTNGTILDTMFTWKQTIGLQFICWTLVAFLYYSQVDANDIDTDGLTRATSVMNAVLGFCLGLYVSLSISRWWEMRQAFGCVVAAALNLMMAVCINTPVNSDVRSLYLKRRITRYATASVALIFRDHDGFDELDLQVLKEKKLLTTQECKKLAGKTQPSAILWLWIGLQLKAAFTSGVLEVDPVEKALLNKYTFRARESLQKINTFIHTQLPLPYIHILVLLTKIFFMLSCLQSSAQIFVYLKSPDDAEVSLFVETLTLFVIPMTYQGLIDLAERVSNPFGTDTVDFPGELYQRSLVLQCNEMIEAAHGSIKEEEEPPQSMARYTSGNFHNGIDAPSGTNSKGDADVDDDCGTRL